MYVGASRQRLRKEDMLKHLEVLRIAKKFADMTGYKIVSQQIESRVVLLSRLDKPIRVGEGCPRGWIKEKERLEAMLEELEKHPELEGLEYKMVEESKI